MNALQTIALLLAVPPYCSNERSTTETQWDGPRSRLSGARDQLVAGS